MPVLSFDLKMFHILQYVKLQLLIVFYSADPKNILKKVFIFTRNNTLFWCIAFLGSSHLILVGVGDQENMGWLEFVLDQGGFFLFFSNP